MDLSSLPSLGGFTLPSPPDRPVGRRLSSSLQRSQGPTVWVMPHPHHGLAGAVPAARRSRAHCHLVSLEAGVGAGEAEWDMFEKSPASGPGLGLRKPKVSIPIPKGTSLPTLGGLSVGLPELCVHVCVRGAGV